jgi:hypothetical protein
MKCFEYWKNKNFWLASEVTADADDSPVKKKYFNFNNRELNVKILLDPISDIWNFTKKLPLAFADDLDVSENNDQPERKSERCAPRHAVSILMLIHLSSSFSSI